MPDSQDLPQLPLAGPERSRLDNGLGLALLSRPGIGKAAISLRVAAGSHDEPPEYPGLAHFLEHLLFLGSAGYPVEQGLMAFVQACGGQVNASTQARHTDYFCEVPAERLGEALARLVDMLINPLLDQVAQLREREVVHAEFLARGKDADTLVATALGQALPAGHRCGAFLAGNRQTLAVESAAFQQALHAFHRRFYRAAQLSLVLVGPQPTAELQALAQRHVGALPSVPRCTQAPVVPLLPLRGRQLRMSLPGAASLHLCFALELPTAQACAALDEALDYLLTWLSDESSGGLPAGLRAARLCRALQARVLYRHGGQALLLLSFSEVDEAGQDRGAIAAAVTDWLGFFAKCSDCDALRSSYQAIVRCRLHSLGPLALARYWQECMTSSRDPSLGLTVRGQGVLRRLLAQMQAAARSISLFASPVEVAHWPSDGFALRMIDLAPASVSPRTWTWQLPAVNPFLVPEPTEQPAMAAQASLRWEAPTMPAEGLGPAAFFGRCWFAEALAPSHLLAFAQARLRELQANAAQIGVTMQLAAESDELHLSLQGPAVMLPRVLAQLLGRLFAPLAPAECSLQPGAIAEMPIRRLLRRLPELFSTPPQRADCQARLEGVGVGLSLAAQTRIERLFRRVSPWNLAEAVAPGPPGRYWRDAGLPAEEATLLLFCPLASRDVASEAGWRLLTHLYQGAFYRRLRTEQQLAYALFCGYRQVRGRRGVLFAVQSPHASAPQILGHIEAFLQAQGERLAALDDGELAIATAELGRQLRAGSTGAVEYAELLWQQHLAGVAPAHDAALQSALPLLARQDLLQLHQTLCQARGGWHVLASSGQAGNGWSASS